ncbi:MAG: PLP-dependent aminotransferase family protein [candidate division Zixibacteria bacterium]|nr:PLP-dependent aminotransferase family protein [candidate division Zixibacteria bacterium]
MSEIADYVENAVNQWQFARSAVKQKSSIIREILKDSSKPGVINFGGGLPAPELFPLDLIQQSCTNVMREHGKEALQYSLTVGIEKMREVIAWRYKQQGVDVTTNEIQITGGAQQGLDVIGRVFIEPGAVVLTETPTYLGALQAFSFYGVKYVSVATDGDGAIPEDVEIKIKEHKPRFLYLVSTFQNPTGITISESRREQLVEIAKKYNCPIVDDNPYGEIRFDGEDVTSLKAIGKEYVIQLGTFSKLISPGLRIGWIASNPHVAPIIERMKQAMDLHTNSFSQYVIADFAAAGHLDKHIELIKAEYGKKRTFMLDMLKKYFSDKATWTTPEGGLFLWLKLADHISATDMLADAIKAKVAYVPGKFFYSAEQDDSTMRLNFCNATEENIEEGIKRLASVVNSIS